MSAPARFSFRACLLLGAFLAVVLDGDLARGQNDAGPEWEIFAGYSYAHPGGTVILPLKNQPYGFGVSVTRNLNSWFGLSLDGGGHYSGSGTTTRKNSMVHTLMIGPKFTYRRQHWAPFAEALIGFNRLSAGGIEPENGITGDPHAPAFALGGGLDIPVKKYLAIRIFQGDYEYGYHNFKGDESFFPVGSSLNGTLKGWRAQSGITWMFGSRQPAMVPNASCSVQPTEVFAGESVSASVTPSNFRKGHSLTYSWSASRGKVQGQGESATVDTTGVPAGSYRVSARVDDPKIRKSATASCSAEFRVNELPKHPPVVSCSATPLSVQIGAAATISCNCSSPDNVTTTVGDWSASAGNLSAEGSTAALNSTGASPGTITVNAVCRDSRGLMTPASTQITVEPSRLTPPTPPTSNKLSECQFPSQTKPWRVDNTCKAILDDVAQRLQHDPDARLVIVGNTEASETRTRLAAERAVNAKAYLAAGEARQAIDPNRIQARTGSAAAKTAEFWVVPAGVSFAIEDTQAVDEQRVKPIPDHPLTRKPGPQRQR
jgi:outer membrane protein OmpA-like peptidoglycan-associated protein